LVDRQLTDRTVLSLLSRLSFLALFTSGFIPNTILCLELKSITTSQIEDKNGVKDDVDPWLTSFKSSLFSKVVVRDV
jgi:hypothetical protein